MQEINVTFDEAAQATIETKGFRGKGCRTDTASLKAALGAETSSTDTAEASLTEIKTTNERRASH